MEVKRIPLKLIVSIFLVVIFIIGLLIWRFFSKTDLPVMENVGTSSAFENEVSTKNDGQEIGISKNEDEDMQEQFDRDRQQQKQTKELRIKLEQINLELEQEKALAEIYKLKNENSGGYKETAIGVQKDIPDIKIEFIGGDNVKKEAILSIAGTNYQVTEKSSLMDNIRVVSISDSSVTLHFSAPQELTKTFEFKPE